MIIDKISNIALHSSIGRGILRGLEYLASTDLNRLDVGRYSIDGDDLFASVADYDTAPRENKRWEAHREYIDIQYVVSGVESIGWAPLDTLRLAEDYDAAADIAWYEVERDFLTVRPGWFVVLFPEDAHMPGVACEQPVRVKKVVVKVKCSDG